MMMNDHILIIDEYSTSTVSHRVMKRKLEEVVSNAEKSLLEEYEEILEKGIIELVSRRAKSC